MEIDVIYFNYFDTSNIFILIPIILLNHFNISVLIYKDGAKVFKINYSYLTNNLTIYKRVDEDDYEYDYIYKGQATPYLYRFLNKL